MLKRGELLVVFLSVWLLPAMAQPFPDGSFEVDRIPWNSTFLPYTQDQLVHGENYKGYPGPIPKMLYALRLDTDHPAVDAELLTHVDRNVPPWFGMCNGWAVASINYQEPNAIVVNGVKLFVGDMKGLLISIFKDNTTILLGEDTSSIGGGLRPEVFERLLNNRVGEQGISLIFDVDNGEQVWNFPVASYIRESQEAGEWTEVHTQVIFPSLTPLSDARDVFLPNEIDYYYRYRTDTLTNYQWIGPSVDDRPQRAWISRDTFNLGVPVATGNHHYSLETYLNLLALSQQEGNKWDLQEPNENQDQAYEMDSELVLGSILEGDVDFYRMDFTAGERMVFDFKVYDGDPLDLTIFNAAGESVLEIPKADEYHFNIRIPTSGTYYFRLTGETEGTLESYYQMVFPEEMGSFRSRVLHDAAFDSVHLRAVNTRDEVNEISAGGILEVAPYGSIDIFNDPPSMLRAEKRTLWAETFEKGTTPYKRYFRDHERRLPYIVPHVTCRNGWKTRLDITRSMMTEPVQLLAYDAMGVLIESVPIPFESAPRFEGGLDHLLSETSLATVAYVEFETIPENLLRGFIEFVNGMGIPVSFDIKASPRYGDMIVFNLEPRNMGGTGIAVVNTSEVANQVFYRIEDKQGAIHGQGNFFMQPGEKWLTTVQALTESQLGGDFTFYFFAHYAVEALAVHVQRDPMRLYGHRLLSTKQDEVSETFLSLPENRDLGGYLFANYNDAPMHLLFEGYSADGALQGRFNIQLGKPLLVREARWVPLTQILQNGVSIVDLEAITHFRVTAPKPFYGFEVVGPQDAEHFHFLPLPNIFDNP